MAETFTGPAGNYRAAMRKDIGWTVKRQAEKGSKGSILVCKIETKEKAYNIARAFSNEGKWKDPQSKGYSVDAEGMKRIAEKYDDEKAEERKAWVKETVLRNTDRITSLTDVSDNNQTTDPLEETGMTTDTEETTEETTEPTPRKRASKGKASKGKTTKAAPKSKVKSATKKTAPKATDSKPRASAEEHGEAVAAMRAEGASWKAIADEHGLGTPGVARRIWSQHTGQHHSMSRVGKGGRLPNDPELLAEMREKGLLAGQVPEALEPLVGVAFSDLKVPDLKAAIKALELEPEGRKKSDIVRALMGAGLPEPEGTPEA